MAKKGMKKGSKCVRYKRTRAGKRCAKFRQKGVQHLVKLTARERDILRARDSRNYACPPDAYPKS